MRIGSIAVRKLIETGHQVTVWDVELSPTFSRDVERSLRLLLRQKKMDKSAAPQVSERIRYGTDWEELRPCEFVVEAVKEDKDVKKGVLCRVGELVADRSVIASNTSTLSIAQLAESVPNPARFLGLHFFNPVVSIELVEVVRGPRTAEETVVAATDFVSDLDKRAFVVPDVPGFVVNHLLFLMINEAVHLVENESVSPETVDQCIRLGAGHPMGPLELADYIGLDVCLAILENLYAATGKDRYRPAALLQRYVQKGDLGRKSGGGFYR